MPLGIPDTLTLRDAQNLLAATAREIDQADPLRLLRNTGPVLVTFLADLLARLGSDWYWVGKTRGDQGKVIPAGFVPRTVRYRGADVEVVGVSHDVICWRPAPIIPGFPDGVQFDVLSSANYLDEPWVDSTGRQAIAGVSGGVIPAHEYRAGNPPIAQGAFAVAGGSGQWPSAPTTSTILDKGTALARLTQLNNFYKAPAGLNRPGGMIDEHGDVDTTAIAQWFYQMVIEGRTWAEVEAQIRASDEWRGKHPNG